MEKKFQVFRNVLEIRNSLRRRVLRRQPIGCCKIASTLNDSGRAILSSGHHVDRWQIEL